MHQGTGTDESLVPYHVRTAAELLDLKDLSHGCQKILHPLKSHLCLCPSTMKAPRLQTVASQVNVAVHTQARCSDALCGTAAIPAVVANKGLYFCK